MCAFGPSNPADGNVVGRKVSALSAILVSVPPVNSVLAPRQNIEGQFRQQADHEKHNEADAPSGNEYSERVTNSCKHKKKQSVSEE
jgi:hypothetical protein